MNLVWLVPALPLFGFLVNSGVAFTRPREKWLVSTVGVGVLLGVSVGRYSGRCSVGADSTSSPTFERRMT